MHVLTNGPVRKKKSLLFSSFSVLKGCLIFNINFIFPLFFTLLLLTCLLGYNTTAKNMLLFLLTPLNAAVPSHQFKHDLFSRRFATAKELTW